MKSLKIFLEKLKINKDTKNQSNIFSLKDIEGNYIEFEPASKKKDTDLNKVFEWVHKHLNIDPKTFEAVRCPYKVDKILFHTNKYELKSVLCYIYPKNQKLIQSSEIRTHFKELYREYENGLKDDEIFGTIVPQDIAVRGRNAYGEVIFTKNRIIWNYIDDYPITISTESVI